MKKENRKKNTTILLVVSLLLITSGIFLNRKNFKANHKVSNTQTYTTPRPIPTSELKFETVNLDYAKDYNFPDLNTLTTKPVQSIECLVDSDSISGEPLYNPETRSSDIQVRELIIQIENHLYSDEAKYKDTKGKIYIENKGEKSKKKITYNKICKSGNIYFSLFEIYGPKIHIGGGGSAPSNLGYLSDAGKFFVKERIDRDSEYIQIPSSVDGEPNPGHSVTTNGSAYYGCRKVLAANTLELVILCGGGDGPSGSLSIFVYNFMTKKLVEKVACLKSGAGKYGQVCYNEKGNVYFIQENELGSINQ